MRQGHMIPEKIDGRRKGRRQEALIVSCFACRLLVYFEILTIKVLLCAHPISLPLPTLTHPQPSAFSSCCSSLSCFANRLIKLKQAIILFAKSEAGF